MRIVLGTPEFEGGGIAAYTRSLARELADLGHAVLVMAPARHPVMGSPAQVATGLNPPESAPLVLNQGGLGPGGQRAWPLPGMWAVIGLDAPPWQPPAGRRLCSNLGRAVPFAVALARSVRSLAVPPDVIEVPEWDSPGALLALGGAVPLVTRLHGHVQLVRRLNGEPFRAEDRLLAALERLTLRRSAMRAANSAYLARLCARDHGLDPSSIAVLPLGVDLTRFRPGDSVAARESLALPQGVPIVGFAGRLEVRKGLPLLMEAWRRVVVEHPTAVLAIAGDTADGSAPHESPAIREMRAAVPPGRLKLLGALPLDRMPSFYRAVDLVCAPSVGEPFGLVVLEAMASGRPVVSLDSGGVPELVEDGVHGFLTEPGYVEVLKSAISRLLGDDLLRLKMGEAGRAQALGAFGVRHMAGRTVEAYEMATSLWLAKSSASGGQFSGFWCWLGRRGRPQAARPKAPGPDRLSAGRF